MPQGIRQVIAANSGGEQGMISPLAREIVPQTHGKFCRKERYHGCRKAIGIATETYR